MEEGRVDDLLSNIVSKRNWYSGTGMTRSDASILKKKFIEGILSEKRKRNILKKLGYQIKQEEVWMRIK